MHDESLWHITCFSLWCLHCIANQISGPYIWIYNDVFTSMTHFQQLSCNVSYHSQFLLLYQLCWWKSLRIWLHFPVINIISVVNCSRRSLVSVQSQFYACIKTQFMLSKCSFFWMQGSLYLMWCWSFKFCLTNYLQCEQWFRYQIPEDWPYQEARQLFKEPLVSTDDEELNLKWSPPDEEVIIKLFENFKYSFKCTRMCILTLCLFYLYTMSLAK